MARAGVRVRRHRALALQLGGTPPDAGRREFLITVLRAGGYAVFISLFGDVVFSQVTTCKAPHDPAPTNNIYAEASSEEVARMFYVEEAFRVCERNCATLTCEGGGVCLQNDGVTPVAEEPKCQPKVGGGYYCTGKVKQCACACQQCTGEHRPGETSPDPGPGDTGPGGLSGGFGTGSDEVEAQANARQNARDKCESFCRWFEDCQPQYCHPDAEPVFGAIKSWPTATGRAAWIKIKKCRCACQG
jgi:hypothetical protein